MKKVFSFCMLFVLGFTLQACMPAYKIDKSASKNIAAANPVLKASDKIVIVMPANGKYKNDTYPKSGEAVADKLNLAMREYTSEISLTDENMTLEAAKEYAVKNKFTHIMYPEITNWEDRQTAFSGRRDRVSIHITVFDVNNNKIADDCIIYGNGKTSSWSPVNKTPEILLDKPFSVYMTGLFGEK
jgi:hypothetical protein